MLEVQTVRRKLRLDTLLARGTARFDMLASAQRMLLVLALSAPCFGCNDEGGAVPGASSPGAFEDAALGVDASAVTALDASDTTPRASATTSSAAPARPARVPGRR